MTNTRTLVLLLLVGCTSSSESSVDVDLDNTDATGKADSIGSRHITAILDGVLEDVTPAQLAVDVVASTQQSEVVRSWVWAVFGSDEANPPADSVEFSGHQLLRVTAVPSDGSTAHFGVVLFSSDKSYKVAPQNVVVCRRGNLKATYFRSVTIDLVNHAFYADDQTWSFSECGLDSSRNFPYTYDGHRFFELVFLPVLLDNPTGSLEGKYQVLVSGDVR